MATIRGGFSCCNVYGKAKGLCQCWFFQLSRDHSRGYCAWLWKKLHQVYKSTLSYSGCHFILCNGVSRLAWEKEQRLKAAKASNSSTSWKKIHVFAKRTLMDDKLAREKWYLVWQRTITLFIVQLQMILCLLNPQLPVWHRRCELESDFVDSGFGNFTTLSSGLLKKGGSTVQEIVKAKLLLVIWSYGEF